MRTLLTSYDVYLIVEKIHHTPEDLHEGDLDERLSEFDAYELRTVAIADLDLNEWNIDDDMVREYADRLRNGEEAPAIVWNANINSIIDGAHRANAAHLAGRTHIQAYVGLDDDQIPEGSPNAS